jgi:hypothetical protein
MPRRLAVLVLALMLAPPAQGAGPADGLFRLVPPDAGVSLAIEDLRGHAREFLASPLAEGLARLPAVRASRESGRLGRIEQALRKVEALVGASVPKIRDDLLGDAVVLTLRVPPGGKPDEARGLLLVRARDRALLDRLIQGVNAAQMNSGELVRVSARDRGGSPYWVREFRQAGRPAESYTVLDGNVFAWSNSEEMVQGVIDRRAGAAPGLDSEPRFRKVRDRLPGRVAASLFADPASLRALMPPSPGPSKPGEKWAAAMIGRYVGAVEYVGAALQWRDGLILHTEETIDPAKLDPGFRRQADAGPSRSPWRGVPATALALVSIRADFGALLDAARGAMSEAGRAKVDDLLLVLGGLMLGHDARADILPRLGPGLSVFVDAPAAPGAGTRPGIPVVALLDAKGAEGGSRVDVSAALDNALRTFLAFRGLDEKAGGGPRRVVTREVRGVPVTTLERWAPFAYAVAADRLAVGRPPQAVARALGGGEASGSPLTTLRAAYFPEAETFACADLAALHAAADRLREPLANRIAARRREGPEAAARDLDQALALMALFRGAFLTSTMAADASSVHRMLGLIARDVAPAAR